MGKFRHYTGEELEKMRREVQTIDYSFKDMIRESELINKRLGEMRDRWRFLKIRRKQLQDVLDEYNYKAPDFRRTM